MANEQTYLPQYILDALTTRVFLKIGGFYDEFLPHRNPKVIESCLQIERDPKHVSSVILYALNNFAMSGSAGFKYRHYFTSIYILLYYKYHDNPAFKSPVFRQLLQHMGIFSKTDVVDAIIHKEIMRMKEDYKCVDDYLKKADTSASDNCSTEELQNKLENVKGQLNDAKKTIREQEKIIDEMKKETPKLKIKLSEGRKLDMIRVIKAMSDLGYFETLDGQIAKPTTVGKELLSVFHYDVNWTSLLSRATRIGKPDATFAELKEGFDLSTQELQDDYVKYVNSLKKRD